MTVKNWSLHQPWCAAVIAENAMLPWRVRCDCKPKNPKESKPKPMPLFYTDETMGKADEK